MIKTENQIYSDIIALLSSALKNFNVEGWKVCQLIQPVKLTLVSPAIYVSIEQIAKRGAQYTRRIKNETDFTYVEAYKEEISVKIFALKRNLVTDTEKTLVAKDVLKLISSWFVSSDGLKQLRKLGYSIYNPSAITQVSFKNDSDNKMVFPSLSITFITEQSWNFSQEEISGYKLKTKGI